MMVVMVVVRLLLLLRLLERGRRSHSIVIASTVVRMVQTLSKVRDWAAFVAGCSFCLVPMVLEPDDDDGDDEQRDRVSLVRQARVLMINHDIGSKT